MSRGSLASASPPCSYAYACKQAVSFTKALGLRIRRVVIEGDSLTAVKKSFLGTLEVYVSGFPGERRIMQPMCSLERAEATPPLARYWIEPFSFP
ncbi:hypothetical protein GQ457_07G001840 [Hibiscus cannabinus]